MAQSFRQIKNRIRGVESTRKVTQAMQMVSAAKLNRINKLLFPMRPYFLKLETIMYELLNSQKGITHPLLEKRISTGKICLCVVTSDTGLCGAYNSNVIRLAQNFIREHGGKERIDLICIGKKGFNYFKKNQYNISDAYLGMNGRYSDQVCGEIEKNLSDIFISGKVDMVYLTYTHYQNALMHRPTVEKFLNIEPRDGETTEYLLEPDISGILNQIIPKYISMKLRLIILKAFTAEQSARAIAMKTATENAKELLQGLVVLRNKVRQANITQEIMEIISSTEALKG